MTLTADELRQRAARIRFLAQRADGQAYHQDMQAADHLLQQAKELEKQQKNNPRTAAAAVQEKNNQAKNNQRRKDLAKIHMLKKKAGLDDDTYRDMLEQITGKRSSAKITGAERFKVIKHLQSSTHTQKRSYPGRPNNTDTSAQMQKIEALLAEAKLPWAYAIAIAKRQHGKTKLEFCDSRELSAVINALIAHAKKNGRRTR